MNLRQYKLALREMGLQENSFRPTPPDDFDLPYIIYTSGGIDEDISNQDLDRLGVLTFNQLIPALNDLQRHDLIIRGERDTGIRYLPSQLIPPPENNPDINSPVP